MKFFLDDKPISLSFYISEGGSSGDETSDFPVEWGKLVSATATTAYTAGKKSWQYVWSIHFENGTLAVLVSPSASSITIDKSLFTSDTSDSLNSAIYYNGSYVNAVAKDDSHYMAWFSTSGSLLGRILYPSASGINWDYGNVTVFTSHWTFDVSDTKIIVYKDGTEFYSGTTSN